MIFKKHYLLLDHFHNSLPPKLCTVMYYDKRVRIKSTNFIHYIGTLTIQVIMVSTYTFSTLC